MKRLPFLPLFFTVLGVLFVAAVWLRLRAYEPIEMASASGAAGAERAMGTAGGPDSGTPAPETSADYTIVSADPSTPAERSANATARERRYQELLRSGPPPSAPPKQPEPSFLDRVVAPIASALGMRPKPEAPPPVAPAERAPERPRPRQEPVENTATMPDENADQNDPETDIIAPQLMAVTFNPPEIGDGEATNLTIIASDNLSGVRTVSGVITSPSGSMQGFACQKSDAEPNHFVTRVQVPKDAPAGEWTIKYLTILDQASNSAHLNASQGALPATAKFRVTSDDADASGPQLKAVWLEKPAMRAGDRNTLFVDAEDEKSGVSQVSGVFISPSRAARIGFGCRRGDAGPWECQVTPPACLDCGVWKLEQIQLQDKANNLTTFRNENQHVSSVALDIAGDRCDSAAPVITQFLLDPTVVSNAKATLIKVQAQAIDDGGCGVASLSGLAIPPGGVGGQRRYITFDPSPDGQNFTGKLEIPQFAAKGQWTIAWIQALDKGHNLRAYSSTEPVVSRVTFRVE